MSDSSDDLDLIREARKNIDDALQAEDEDRKEALDDLKFVAGDQWTNTDRQRRERDGRPCLTTNLLPAFVRQVTNDSRQNRPSIKVHPVDDYADVETAEVLQGLIRHIEYSSDADYSYDTAVESAARCGRGYWVLATEYESPRSFNQVIKYKRVRNPFSIVLDHNSVQPDGSDARFGAILDDMSLDEFKTMWPDAKTQASFELENVGTSQNWLNERTIRIATYYYVEETKATLYKMPDGTIGYADEIGDVKAAVESRDSVKRRICIIKMTAMEILERSEWAGKWIPIFPVYGDEVDIEGKITRSGLVRYSKDSQRMYNYWNTTETELIALAPKSPFIGAEGQFDGHEDEWQRANTDSIPYLEYRQVDLNGQAAPPPQRQPFAGVPAGVMNAKLTARDDVKATTGIFDASLGARGNETSGKAILARQREGDVGNFHYTDNLSRTLRHCGRCLIDLIPHIYDTQRVVQILGEDGETKAVTLNQPLATPIVNEQTQAIKRVLNDVAVGTYDVTVTPGPSYTTKRQEAAEGMSQLAQAWPPLMQIAGDKVVKALDWPEAQEIGERIKRTIDPKILGDEEGGDQQPQIPPQVQAAFQQLQQHAQMLEQELQKRNVDLEKARISAEAQIEVAKINSTSKEDVAELQGVIQMLLKRMPPPPALTADVMRDIGEPEDSASLNGQQGNAPQMASEPGT